MINYLNIYFIISCFSYLIPYLHKISTVLKTFSLVNSLNETLIFIKVIYLTSNIFFLFIYFIIALFKRISFHQIFLMIDDIIYNLVKIL